MLATPVIAAVETAETLPVEPGITPDSPLYGVDRFVENVQVVITTDELKRAELRYKFAEERLAEANDMSKKNKTELADRAVEDYENELNETEKEMGKAVALGKNITALTEHVAAMTSKHLVVLQRVYEKAPESAQLALLRVIEKATVKSVEIISHNEDGEELKENIRTEIREKGIDTGKIKDAVSDLTKKRAGDVELPVEPQFQQIS